MAETSEGYRTRLGTVSIEDGVIIDRMRIGSFRKRDHEDRYKIAEVVALRRVRSDGPVRGDGPGFSVTLYLAGHEVGYGLHQFVSQAEVEAFTAEVVQLNPAVEVNPSLDDRRLSRDGDETLGSGAPSRAPEIQVKSYKDGKEYAHDAQRMSRAGWQVMSTADQDRHTAVGRTLGKAVLTGGAGLLLTGRSKKGDQVVVTWVRGQATPESAPQPLPADITRAGVRIAPILTLAGRPAHCYPAVGPMGLVTGPRSSPWSGDGDPTAETGDGASAHAWRRSAGTPRGRSPLREARG